MNNATLATPSKSLLRSAGLMGAATFSSRILGLVREQVFAMLFGAGNATDAFNIAFRIPNLLRDLFAEGAMSASLVPTFTQVRSREGDRRAWRVAGLVFRVLFILTVLLMMIGLVFAEPLVQLYASAYRQIPGKFELTVTMTRVLLPFFPLIALAAAFMGILNACGTFFLPAFSSALFNFTSILVGVGFVFILPSFGVEPIIGMAVGVVAGAFVQAFCQLPSLYQAGYRWIPKSIQHSTQPATQPDPATPPWHQDPALRQMLLMLLPGMVGLAATQINVLVNSILATSQAPGAVSWLNYAFRLMQFPIGVFGVSLAAVALPALSKQWVERDLREVSATLSLTLRRVFAINLPASAGLAFLGYPIIQLIFEYGRFGPQDTANTALALAAYALGLTAYSCVKVLVPACYAFGNTKLAVYSSLLSVALTITLNLLMIGPFGYAGLALGTSLAALFNALFLFGVIQKQIRVAQKNEAATPLTHNGMDAYGLLKSLLGHASIALAMGTVCFLTYKTLNPLLPDNCLFSSLGTAGVVLIRTFKVGMWVSEGILLVLLLSRLTGFTEFSDAFHFFVERMKKKLWTRPT